MQQIEGLMAAFDEHADWNDIWTHVAWAGLIVAKQAAVAMAYGKEPASTGIGRIKQTYKEAKNT